MKNAKKKCKVRFEPSGLKTEVVMGTTLLDAARQVEVYLSSICGGDGYCGKCKVVVNSGEFQAKPTTLLTPQETWENVVLACQTKVLSDMVITVGKSHSLEKDQILETGEVPRSTVFTGQSLEETFARDPLCRKIYLELARPTVADHTADYERITVAIKQRLGGETPVMQMGFRVLQDLPQILHRSNYKVTATVGFRDGAVEIVQVEPGNCADKNYSVAVDLGTTTVVAHLVNPVDGCTLDTEAKYNSQINFGEDYIRRIIYAEQNNAFENMQECIVKDVNTLIMTLAEKNNISLNDITAVVCAGNTAMIHFILNLDPTRIRREPYVASASFIPPIRAAEAGIQINKRGLLYCLPSVAAYVGADIVAGVLATQLNKLSGVFLFLDIGTNGEVVLGNKDWMMCASSSAGPAFEGSGVKHGMRASSGAIEELKINFDGSVEYKTIGDTNPIGICGSGLLDILSELFANGIIDRTGRFQPENTSTKFRKKIIEGDEGLEFILVARSAEHKQIVITQADINNLVRSKAGVFASVKVLMDSTQTSTDDLDGIFLAGGFGNYLDVKKTIKIGMLPDVPPEKIHFVGNTAIAGAKAALLSRDAKAEADKIASNMTYSDLMSHPEYMEEFIRANFLPHTDLSLFSSMETKTV